MTTTIFSGCLFFQEIKECDNSVVIGYKMHDVIYALLQSVVGSECTMLDQHLLTLRNFTQIHRASFVCDFKSSTISKELYEAKHL